MIPMPPDILRRIAALPKAVVAEVLSIFAAYFEYAQNTQSADFEVPQNTQIKQVEALFGLTQKTQKTQVEAFEHTQKTQNAAVDAQVAPFCQVPPAPLPSSISRVESREEGSKENKALSRKASTLKPARAREFEEFWQAFPKRINKQAAMRKFDALIKTIETQHIIDAAKRYAKATQATEKQFIKSPDVWLNKGCYDDELPLANGAEHNHPVVSAGVHIKVDTPQWEAWDAWYRSTKGKSPPCHNGAWNFPQEWPPNAQ